MDTTERKTHWENIYRKRKSEELSWYQELPETSLNIINSLQVPPSKPVIDIGGGDSHLVDSLLSSGFTDISILDISLNALERSKSRLAERAQNVTWICEDVAAFQPKSKYVLWHDRAVFHFLTTDTEVQHYVNAVSAGVEAGGYFVLGTFSEQGPEKCSGLDIRQYSREKILNLYGAGFSLVESFTTDHNTPSGAKQNFLFCVLKKKSEF